MKPVKLTIIDGPHAGRILTVLPQEQKSIGRGTTADYSVMDRMMSRVHFTITCDQDGWKVRDLDSRNGTKVNGDQVTDSKLSANDVILAGDTKFEVNSIAEFQAVLIRASEKPQESTLDDEKSTWQPAENLDVEFD